MGGKKSKQKYEISTVEDADEDGLVEDRDYTKIQNKYSIIFFLILQALKFYFMKKIMFSIVVLICFCANLKAQVIQQKADKWQLINGVKLKPTEVKSTKNLIKIEATKVSPSSHSRDIADIPKKKDKNLKPPKILKYGNQKSSNIIKKEDEE